MYSRLCLYGMVLLERLGSYRLFEGRGWLALQLLRACVVAGGCLLQMEPQHSHSVVIPPHLVRGEIGPSPQHEEEEEPHITSTDGVLSKLLEVNARVALPQCVLFLAQSMHTASSSSGTNHPIISLTTLWFITYVIIECLLYAHPYRRVSAGSI